MTVASVPGAPEDAGVPRVVGAALFLVKVVEEDRRQIALEARSDASAALRCSV